jgi:hypothetical protein
MDFAALPGPAPGLRTVSISPGNTALLASDGILSPPCLDEARADRLGTIELEPLIWRYPPLPGEPVVVARDLGPSSNVETLRAFPDATPFLLVDGGPDAPWRILPYQDGMALIWGEAAAPDGDGM